MHEECSWCDTISAKLFPKDVKELEGLIVKMVHENGECGVYTLKLHMNGHLSINLKSLEV